MQKLDEFYSTPILEERQKKHKSDVQKAIRKHFWSKVRERVAICICVVNFIFAFIVTLIK